MTADHLARALGIPTDRAARWVEPLDAAMAAHGITTPARIAAFLAQIGHESGRLSYTREIWGPTRQQAGYEGRADLGNTEPGDGFVFRGRGLLQISGRANYRAAGQALGEDFEAHPELLETPIYAAMSAAWYWQRHGLNELADAGDFAAITRRINGGTWGQADRLALWEQAKEVFA